MGYYRNPKVLPNGDRDFWDLHVIIDKYKKRNSKKETDRTKQHFFVSKQEIVDNDYDLSLSKYKEEIYEEIIYEEPKIILKKLSKLEGLIKSEIEELNNILWWSLKN